MASLAHPMPDKHPATVIVHPFSGVQLRKATPEEVAAEHEQINPDNVREAISTLVDLFGVLGTQNLFDTLGASDTHPLRQTLAEIALTKEGRY